MVFVVIDKIDSNLTDKLSTKKMLAMKALQCLAILIVCASLCRGDEDTVATVELGGEVKFDFSPWSFNEVRCVRNEKVIEPSEKFVFEEEGGNYLKVKNVGVEDFGMYKFQKSPAHLEEKKFNLMVVEGITMTVTPSEINSPGDIISVKCRSEINVEYSLRLTEEQQLHFHLEIGGDEKEVIDKNLETIGPEKRALEVDFNVTIEGAMDQKNLTCRLASEIPAFEMRKSSEIRLAFGPTEIRWYNRGDFKIGEVINCTSHAHPEPFVTWQPIKLPSTCKKQYEVDSLLTFSSLTLACAGYQSWKCVVMYDPDGLNPDNFNNKIYNNDPNYFNKNNNNNGNNNNDNNRNNPNNNTLNNNLNEGSLAGGSNNALRRQMEKIFNFTVGGVEPEESKGGLTPTQRTILGVVLGLGIPLLLIIILLITCCVCRGKGGKKGRKTTLAKAVDPKKKKQPGPIKTVSGAKPASGVSVNSAPNPSAVSRSPPPNVIRGSPGIPDIGARHLGGSGSIPQLNDSMDGGNQRQYNNYSEISKAPQSVNFGKADLGGNKAFTDI